MLSKAKLEKVGSHTMLHLGTMALVYVAPGPPDVLSVRPMNIIMAFIWHADVNNATCHPLPASLHI